MIHPDDNFVALAEKAGKRAAQGAFGAGEDPTAVLEDLIHVLERSFWSTDRLCREQFRDAIANNARLAQEREDTR